MLAFLMHQTPLYLLRCAVCDDEDQLLQVASRITGTANKEKKETDTTYLYFDYCAGGQTYECYHQMTIMQLPF